MLRKPPDKAPAALKWVCTKGKGEQSLSGNAVPTHVLVKADDEAVGHSHVTPSGGAGNASQWLNVKHIYRVGD